MLSTNRPQIQTFKIYCNSRKKPFKSLSKRANESLNTTIKKVQTLSIDLQKIFLKTNTYKQASWIILLVLFYLEPLQQNYTEEYKYLGTNRGNTPVSQDIVNIVLTNWEQVRQFYYHYLWVHMSSKACP